VRTAYEHSVGVLRPTRVSISTGLDLDKLCSELMRGTFGP
jgi:hypothetical protein